MSSASCICVVNEDIIQVKNFLNEIPKVYICNDKYGEHCWQSGAAQVEFC